MWQTFKIMFTSFLNSESYWTEWKPWVCNEGINIRRRERTCPTQPPYLAGLTCPAGITDVQEEFCLSQFIFTYTLNLVHWHTYAQARTNSKLQLMEPGPFGHSGLPALWRVVWAPAPGIGPVPTRPLPLEYVHPMTRKQMTVIQDLVQVRLNKKISWNHFLFDPLFS